MAGTELTLEKLKEAVKGTAAAFRCVTEYQPAGGAGDKVFPPTYEGGKYATEKRRLPGLAEPVDCVLLDSVQSQANRMELALLDAWERRTKDKPFPLPVIVVDFKGNDMPKVLRITSLEAPHRIADALLRDSLLDGQPFRKSPLGKRLDEVDNRNATALFELCPTALIFGMWDSTGPKGGLGAKFSRAIVSEIIGIASIPNTERMGYRIDPLGIVKAAAVIADGNRWELASDAKTKGAIRPSEINHSNIPFNVKNGGVTLANALQTTVISLPALRRLRFPLNGTYNPVVDDAARTALAALGLCAATLAREQGCDLRSRCQLHAVSAYEWELLDKAGEQPERFVLKSEGAVKLFRDAVTEAKSAKLPWMDKELLLTPSPELVALVKKSQELAAATGGAEEGGN